MSCFQNVFGSISLAGFATARYRYSTNQNSALYKCLVPLYTPGVLIDSVPVTTNPFVPATFGAQLYTTVPSTSNWHPNK